MRLRKVRDASNHQSPFTKEGRLTRQPVKGRKKAGIDRLCSAKTRPKKKSETGSIAPWIVLQRLKIAGEDDLRCRKARRRGG